MSAAGSQADIASTTVERRAYQASTEEATVVLASPDAARIGQRIGSYEVVGVIGRGAMGVVYKAQHTTLEKPVAIKVLTNAGDHATNEETLREARLASRIRHPNMAAITDFCTAPDGAPCIVMEYLEGETLRETLNRRGTLPVREAIAIAKQIASVLGAAHHASVIHRDLKPDNVFLISSRGAATPAEASCDTDDDAADLDFVKLLDFGVAKIADMGPSDRTRRGIVVGTPHYMSPEQATGRGVDARSDLYALGVLMYEMLAGTPPFTGESAVEILVAHVQNAVPSLRSPQTPQMVDAALDQIVGRCLAKSPERRFATTEELGRALEELSGKAAGGARETGLHTPAPNATGSQLGVNTITPSESIATIGSPRRHAGLIGAALGVALVATFALILRAPTDEPTDVPPPRPVPAPLVTPSSVVAPTVATPERRPSTKPSGPREAPPTTTRRALRRPARSASPRRSKRTVPRPTSAATTPRASPAPVALGAETPPAPAPKPRVAATRQPDAGTPHSRDRAATKPAVKPVAKPAMKAAAKPTINPPAPPARQPAGRRYRDWIQEPELE